MDIFSKHGLRIFDVEELPTHGGSLRIYACHGEDSSKGLTNKVGELMAREEKAGFKELEHYLSFGERVKAMKLGILSFFVQAKTQGKTIVGYGAPAKGNTLLNYCGIRTDYLEYTVDRSNYKQNHFLPGTHIPIYAPDKIKETRPDYVLILPWNFQDEIIEQIGYIRDWGGKFIVPIPKVRVIDDF